MTSFKLDQSEIEHYEEESWAVSYADMITLLLAFFVLFFSIEQVKPPAPKNLKLEMNHFLAEKINSSNVAKVIDPNQYGLDENFIKSIKGVAHENGDSLVVEFPNISFFESAQTNLSRKGEWALFQFVKSYLPYAGNYTLSIRAYTDSRPVIPRPEQRYNDNLELSALRAISTMRVLQKMGIPLNRMRPAGYGEMQITADFLNDQNKKMALDFSRKVVLVIEQEVNNEKK